MSIPPAFVEPENKHIKIWRFMDFTKFTSLLDKKSLFFSRSDKLGDPFEGSFTKANIQLRPSWYGEGYPEINKLQTDYVKKVRFHTFLSCWHVNEDESDAMWKIYTNKGKGVAIQTTFKKLKDVLKDESNIYAGLVKYIDYDHYIMNEGNTFWPYIHKRKSFAHERELRAITVRIPKGTNSINTQGPLGINVPVNLDELIEKIYVAPTSPDWFYEIVNSILKKYDLTKDIEYSKLSDEPVF